MYTHQTFTFRSITPTNNYITKSNNSSSVEKKLNNKLIFYKKLNINILFILMTKKNLILQYNYLFIYFIIPSRIIIASRRSIVVVGIDLANKSCGKNSKHIFYTVCNTVLKKNNKK